MAVRIGISIIGVIMAIGRELLRFLKISTKNPSVKEPIC